jgi:hypothetical protein
VTQSTWPPRFRPKTCAWCGAEFTPPSGVAKYCPGECRRLALNARQAAWRDANPDKVQQYYATSAPTHQAYLQQHAQEISLKAKEWKQDNRKRWRDYKNRYMRSRRASLRMCREDRELSVAYRQAIRNDPCLYCGGPGEEDDHYFPVAKGGTDHWYNLVRSCLPCNRSKAAHCGTWFRLRMGV